MRCKVIMCKLKTGNESFSIMAIIGDDLLKVSQEVSKQLALFRNDIGCRGNIYSIVNVPIIHLV